MTRDWQVRELKERDTIRCYLNSDRLYAAYALGDLEPSLYAQCRWWLAEPTLAATDEAWALVLHFAGLAPHAVVCLGKPDGVGLLLAQTPLPDVIYLICREEHLQPARRSLSLPTPHQMARMVLDSDRFRPAPSGNAVHLTLEDLDALRGLYALDPDFAKAFAPYQLADGVFYGVKVEDTMVSVAGTHLVAPTERIGAVGNIYTHPAYRGRGHAASCTTAVCTELLARGLTVVLNVGVHNAPALDLYRRLGFRKYCTYYEAVGTKMNEEQTDD
jgi:ribosomal protein S18 acetylase RimI-like enzyme